MSPHPLPVGDRLLAVEQVAQPLVMADQRILEVPAVLSPLLPAGGLKRGSTVAVAAGDPHRSPSGATTVALALMAATSAAGSWLAAVGLPELGLGTAAQLGISLERFALVPEPKEQWAMVTAALLDAMDVVLLGLPPRARPAEVRKLMARGRERGAVLVTLGEHPVEGADIRVTVTASSWQGLGWGHGHLQVRRVELNVEGRGAASRRRRLSVWLPGPDGQLACLEDLDAGVGVVVADQRPSVRALVG